MLFKSDFSIYWQERLTSFLSLHRSRFIAHFSIKIRSNKTERGDIIIYCSLTTAYKVLLLEWQDPSARLFRTALWPVTSLCFCFSFVGAAVHQHAVRKSGDMPPRRPRPHIQWRHQYVLLGDVHLHAAASPGQVRPVSLQWVVWGIALPGCWGSDTFLSRRTPFNLLWILMFHLSQLAHFSLLFVIRLLLQLSLKSLYVFMFNGILPRIAYGK